MGAVIGIFTTYSGSSGDRTQWRYFLVIPTHLGMADYLYVSFIEDASVYNFITSQGVFLSLTIILQTGNE
jgi:hypothetical protein